MKTFTQFAQEIKKSIDQEDNIVLTNFSNDIELTSVATAAHAQGSFLIYNKKVYEVTTAISVGDTLIIYPTTNYNIKAADDVMSMISAVNTALGNKTNKPTIKTATLAVGSTSVTFTQIPTSGNYIIDFETNAGINYTAIDLSTAGQITLTFEAQEAAVTVWCVIQEV